MKIRVITHAFIILILILLFVVLSLVAVSFSVVQETTIRKEALSSIARQISDLRFVSAEYLITGEARPLLQWELGLQSLRESVSSSFLGNDQESNILKDSLIDQLDRIQSYFETLQKDVSAASFSEPKYRSARQELLDAERRMTLLVNDFNLRIAQRVTVRQYRANVVWVLGVAMPIVSLLFVLIFWIPKKILSPLKRFDEVIREVGKGNFAYEFKFFSDDEFGDIADSVRMMIDRLAEMEVLSHRELDDLRKEKQDLVKTNRLLIDREIAMVELKERLKNVKKHDL